MTLVQLGLLTSCRVRSFFKEIKIIADNKAVIIMSVLGMIELGVVDRDMFIQIFSIVNKLKIQISC